ncbi:MAG: hypothetical protein U1E83_11420 [Methylotetracoccus sp.]
MTRLTKTATLMALLDAGLSGESVAHMVIHPGSEGQIATKSGIPTYEDGAYGSISIEVGHACIHGVVPWADVTTEQVIVGIPNGKNLKIVNTELFTNSGTPFEPPYKELGPASPDASGDDWAIPWLKPNNSTSFKVAHPFYDQITPVNLWGEAVIDQAPRSVA